MKKECKKCGSKNLYLEPRIKGQDVMTADMVALKCKDCGSWLKWCPKDERKYYYANTNSKQDSKWQKLKEWLEEQQNNFKLISKTLGKADYVLLSNCIKSVLSEMAKLEGEDE